MSLLAGTMPTMSEHWSNFALLAVAVLLLGAFVTAVLVRRAARAGTPEDSESRQVAVPDGYTDILEFLLDPNRPTRKPLTQAAGRHRIQRRRSDKTKVVHSLPPVSDSQPKPPQEQREPLSPEPHCADRTTAPEHGQAPDAPEQPASPIADPEGPPQRGIDPAPPASQVDKLPESLPVYID